MYRFSIVIPAHNGAQFLHLAIGAALQQTRLADEVLLIDDASTDATVEIAKSYESKLKYHFHQEATGFVDAWNRAIELASGDFVTILHQDDLLHPEYLEHIEKALRRFPSIKHFYSACNYIDEHGAIIKGPPEPYSLEPVFYSGKEYARNYLNGVVTNNHIHRCPGVTTQRNLLLAECTYRKEAGHIADDDFFLRVGAFTDVVGISQPLASFRHHGHSVTGQRGLLTLELARDYVFQVLFHKGNKTLLDDEDITQVQLQAVKFINLLLFQSLLYKQQEWTQKAFGLRDELDKMLPSFMEKNLPLWARKMWGMTSAKSKKNRTAAFYVAVLNAIIKSRDYVKALLKHEFTSNK
ncbi:MAG TPA: hypothetical protein DCP92_17480 [Nitrospiraceae bacterium]|jgi:glycosyltransferase involved in cell wall biosynthesis|nr:hypothetical protein [Nitrospiraceae bacterium]